MQTTITRISKSKQPEDRQIISIDGEGWNIPLSNNITSANSTVESKGWHSYVILGAADDRGFAKSLVHDSSKRESTDTKARNYGLITKDILEFILDLPWDAMLTSFAFSYDATKIMADLPLINQRELSLESKLSEEEYKTRVYKLANDFDIPVERVIDSEFVGLATTVYDHYVIKYTPRKSLSITDLTGGYGPVKLKYQGKNGGWFYNKNPRREWHRKAIIWDSFGYFQKPFVGALNDYRCGQCDSCKKAREHCKAKCKDCAVTNYCTTAPWTPDDINHISVMKEHRGEFNPDEQKEVLEYCLTECRYLTFLMRDLLLNIKSFDKEMLRWMTRYDGSGAVASAWNRTKHIKDYLPYRYPVGDNKYELAGLPEEVALGGYFGGRFEISEIGYMGDLHSYDINSAYPHVTTTLPCLKHGRFVQTDEYQPGKFGVYLTGSLTSGRYAPFPFRTEEKDTNGLAKSAIYYLHGGLRWVWSNANESMSEIAIARKHYGKEAIPIVYGYVFEQDCNEQPFKDIPHMYKQRQEFVLQGNGIEKVIKLILNSLYGKTAQSIGWSLNKDTNEVTPPPYQCFIWAGLITSGCRAMILDAINQPNADVVSIATDGILSRTPIELDAPKDKILGKWDYGTVEDGYLFQSGVYTYLTWDKWGKTWKRTYKTRGFSSKEIPAEVLISEWKLGNRTVKADLNHTRFIPMRSGVLRNDALEYIGQWIPSIHDVSFTHNRRIGVYDTDENGDITGTIERLSEACNIGCHECNQCKQSKYELCDNPPMSGNYIPKQTWEDVLNAQPNMDDMEYVEDETRKPANE